MSKHASSFRQFADPTFWSVSEEDRRIFTEQLRAFVPPDSFDAHSHWYDLRHLLPEESFAAPIVGWQSMQSSLERWMGDRRPAAGLGFGFPKADVDCAGANELVAAECKRAADCRGLMLIRPNDDPASVERQLEAGGFAGFKVYHVFADRDDTFHAELDEYLPDWAWQLADEHDLWITLHMVLPKALADVRNADAIVSQCRRYRNAKLVLAHAARGFNASHTVRAVDRLRGLDNVFFDTSAICEPAAFEAIIKATGVTRLMYGSDFPVSEIRGKAISVGDGFAWLYEHNVDWEGWPHGQPTLVGIESLLALKQACRTMCLQDSDIERIFGGNARQLLGIEHPDRERVQDEYRRAKRVIPGGVQLLSKRPEMYAPERWPAYYEQAMGCEVVDTSGRRYIDMSSNGILSCLLGFADPDVNEAVIRRVHLGSMSTQQTNDEAQLAELLCELHPWAANARFARTGGEAMAMAVRIARATTGRDKVAICGYHGWHDWYLAASHQQDALRDHLLPGLSAAGVPRALAGTCFPFHYNRLDELDEILAEHSDQLAAIVFEPIRHTAPEPDFLSGLQSRAADAGALLIADEISAGWRLCTGGSHLPLGIEPDMAVFAKAISNGYAMSAVIGNRASMAAVERSFISSAYWTEAIGPAAALATVRKLRGLEVCDHIAKIGQAMQEGWLRLGEETPLTFTVRGRADAVLLGIDHPDANALMTLYTTRMLDRGFLAAGGFNPTWAHSLEHVEQCLSAARDVAAELSEAAEAGDAVRRIGGREKHTMFRRLVD